MHVEYREVPMFRRFGVELEVSATQDKPLIASKLELYENLFGCERPVQVTPTLKGWADTVSNDYWHVKYDSTCGPLGKYNDHGWEVASYIARGHNDIRNISKAALWLGNFLETNKNCGLHIHVDVGDFTAEQMGRLLMAWVKIEHLLFVICDPCRLNNQYCRPLRDRMEMRYFGHYDCLQNADRFWLMMQPDDHSTHNNSDKKHALNTVGFAIGLLKPNYSKKTIELRMPECKLNESHVFGWICLFLNFVESSKSLIETPRVQTRSKTLQDLMFYLGLADEKKFLLLGSLLCETKKWFLQKLSDTDSVLKNEASNHLEFISKI